MISYIKSFFRKRHIRKQIILSRDNQHPSRHTAEIAGSIHCVSLGDNNLIQVYKNTDTEISNICMYSEKLTSGEEIFFNCVNRGEIITSSKGLYCTQTRANH